MNKKLCLVTLVLLVFSAGGAFSFGIGLQAGWDNTIPGNFAVTFKLDEVPVAFAGNYYIGDEKFALGFSADYWFVNPRFPFRAFPAWLHWFVGGGAGINFGTDQEDFNFDFSLRVPVGINAFFLGDHFEPYIQFVPKLKIGFLPSLRPLPFGFDAAIGFRAWFT
jgi:hypothetical protein